MDDLEYSTILIELDALFDMRLALIASLGNQHLDACYTKDYHERLIDSFPTLSFEQFQYHYKNRNRSLLKEAHITPMGLLLKDFAFNTLKQAISTPYQYKPKIVINTYPYELNEAEINEIIIGLIELTLGKADIEAIHMNYEALTPFYVKQQFDAMILYDYSNWIEIHSVNEKFKKIICPNVTLLGPAIYFKPFKVQDSQDHIKNFEAMQTIMNPLINLRLLPIEQFSIIIKSST